MIEAHRLTKRYGNRTAVDDLRITGIGVLALWRAAAFVAAVVLAAAATPDLRKPPDRVQPSHHNPDGPPHLTSSQGRATWRI